MPKYTPEKSCFSGLIFLPKLNKNTPKTYSSKNVPHKKKITFTFAIHTYFFFNTHFLKHSLSFLVLYSLSLSLSLSFVFSHSLSLSFIFSLSVLQLSVCLLYLRDITVVFSSCTLSFQQKPQ